MLLAIHLLRDGSREPGAGAAYATNHPDHLLNVRASHLSASRMTPGISSAGRNRRVPAGQGYGPDDFAPRMIRLLNPP